MASNFKIFIERNGDNLHLKLRGDFDGTSACELLNVLNEKCGGGDKIFIHTGGLKEIYSFGRETFQNNFYTLKGHVFHLQFTGRNAAQVAPEGSLFSGFQA
jgi:hypothetical protein